MKCERLRGVRGGWATMGDRSLSKILRDDLNKHNDVYVLEY